MLRFDDYEVLTFDCYGTLIDWESGILSAIRPVLVKRNLRLPDQQILNLYAEFEADLEKGKFISYKAILQKVIQKFGKKLNFEPSTDELDRLSESLKHWRPFPDTVDSLRRLKSRYKLAIISNIDNNLFSYSARHLEVPFDWVITAEQARSYKPSLNNFHQAIERIGLPKERILHVAQSLYHDILPAKKIGLATVWVNRRHNKPGPGATRLAKAQPDLEVPDLRTLVSTIGLA
jgi:2-haloacid dehalogenase